MNLLCVAAWEPELTRFRELARWIRTEPVGIGLVDAAIRTAELVADHKPQHVAFLGTCGSARADLAIGDVILATEVTPRLEEGSELLGARKFAPAVDPALRAALEAAGAKPARVVNTVGVTTSDALATEIAKLGDVEHLESLGVVRACERAGVPCAIVLAVANEVGARGRDQWKANHVAASARAAEALFAAISRVSTRAPSPA